MGDLHGLPGGFSIENLEEAMLVTIRTGLLQVALFGSLMLSGCDSLPSMGGSAPEGYPNSNIDFGKVSTDEADEACPQNGHDKLVCLANRLKAGLDPALLARLQRSYSAEEASQWSNFPPAGYPDRIGPTLGDFTVAQQGFVKAMLIEAGGIAANEGFDEIEQILNADDFLVTVSGTGPGFSSSNFHVAFLGVPAASGKWEFYFGGHHLAFANTYMDGKLVGGSPSFRGVEPFGQFEMNGRINDPLSQERDAFAAMLASLDPAQLALAKLDETVSDLVVGPQNDAAFPAIRGGLAVGRLTQAQQALVIAAIETYVGDLAPSDAEAVMLRYRSELPQTLIAFSGTKTVDAQNDYVRIDGPSVWIELSMQDAREVEGIHPHSIWRDKTGDYGRQ